MHSRPRALTTLVACAALSTVALAPAASASAPVDSFYHYTGTAPLSSYEPGTVLKSRTLAYHVVGLPVPLKVVQLQYRTSDQLDRPTVNITSVVQPTVRPTTPKAVSYQSFYDSLNPEDGPSRAIAGNVSFGGLLPNFETTLLLPLLAKGYTVIVADTEGPRADFAVGPEYGINTLDSIRAAVRTPSTGLRPDTKVGALGYSGGAIATGWAAQLAPSYAPDVNRNLVGASQGGVLVNPARNLGYIDGSAFWAGVAPMAIIGIARAFEVDFTPYLSDYGRSIMAKMDKASIANVLGQYPGLTWAQLAKPAYADPYSIPEFAQTVPKINMGNAASPKVPLLIGQGAGGWLEGTPGNKPGIGAGDGVMIAGDVRTLARQFCADGTAVSYQQYDALSHFSATPPWVASSLDWLDARFAAKPAPNNCASIKPGNPITDRPQS